ncbi:MAG: hypothetical protein KDJ38_18495 [Gammaproteobacteria bacterium]|nr:hypothetical protein [Gammaproteobacteria bacterium]
MKYKVSGRPRIIVELEFIPTNEKLPPYGVPVLIKSSSGVMQNVTYMLEGADDTPDWFEPYHFDHDDNTKVLWHEVESWALMPDWDD